MFIEWSSKYELGIKEIDDQHRELVRIINSLHQMIKEKKTNDQMGPLFDDLILYIKKHFKTEEFYFRANQFPNELIHLSEHQEFVSEISALHLRFFEGEDIAFEVTRFLREWLLNHILISDKEYVPYLIKK